LRSLTLTEARAVRLVAEGRTDAEIAAQLDVSIPTVERSVAGALQKLALRSRTELALLVSPPDVGPRSDGEA
jgi:DNA-binding CsgD family transcriptional regulator